MDESGFVANCCVMVIASPYLAFRFLSKDGSQAEVASVSVDFRWQTLVKIREKRRRRQQFHEGTNSSLLLLLPLSPRVLLQQHHQRSSEMGKFRDELPIVRRETQKCP